MHDKIVDLRRYRTPALTGSLDGPDTPCPHARMTAMDGGTALQRDALGQMPIHVMRSGSTWLVSNTIKDLLLSDAYRYESIMTIPNGAILHLGDGGESHTEEVVNFFEYLPPNFEKQKLGDVEYSAAWIRNRLDWVCAQLTPCRGLTTCLLSGGVDSMIAAYLMSRRPPKGLTACTLGLSSKVEDVALAKEYAKAFALEHLIVAITFQDVVDAVRESIWRSEIYHLYNVYCAVGMVILARDLCQRNVDFAFTGEGANEAFGDYHDWTVTRGDGSPLVLQSTDIAAFNSPRGRHAYIWGNPASASRGLVNRQLGSGLAKHGVSRMHKPMYEYGVQLLSPFMDLGILRVIASISADDLARAGGKAGFMSIVMTRDVAEGRIPESFLENRKKTRLQDANPHGQGGITEVLLEAGYDQGRALDIFNNQFRASMANDARFTETKLRG